MHRTVAAALIAPLLALPAQHALAHAIPVESDPTDGAVTVDAPKQVHLRLSERVSAQFTAAQLLDASGRVMAGIEIPVAQPEPTLLVFALPKLSNGAYTLFWKTFSMDDGHFSKGLLQFGVGPNADLASAAVPEIATRPTILEIAVRWLNLGLLVMLVGAIGIVGAVLGSRHGAAETGTLLQMARRRACAWTLGCACSAFVAGGAVLFAETTALLSTQTADTQPLQAAWQILHDTRWGAFWLARQVLLLAEIGALFLLYRQERAGIGGLPMWRRMPWLSAALLSLALVTLQTLMGHAGSVGDGIGWVVAADVLHLAAAGMWVGGIFALAYALLPLMRRGHAEFEALAYLGWAAFSRLAAAAVALLFVTGFYAIGRQVASLDALITTFYGQSILTKVALVLAMGAIGLMNAALLHPNRIPAAITRFAGQARGRIPVVLAHLPRLIRADMCIALIVLALTGAITASAPPLGAEFNIAPEDVRQQQSSVVDDVMVTLSAKPGRPGQNLLTAFVGSSIRPAKAEIVRVMLRFAFQGRDLGHLSSRAEQVEPGRYVVAGRQLSVAGRWQIDVVIRRRGIPDTIVPFEWIVPPAAALPPTIVSKDPIRGATRNVSVAILLLALGAVAVRTRKLATASIAVALKNHGATARSENPSAVVSPTAQ